MKGGGETHLSKLWPLELGPDQQCGAHGLTTRNRQRGGEEALELPGATAVTHRPHNRLQESQQRAVPPHHGWLVVRFPVHARTNHDFGKSGDGDHGVRHCC